MHRTTIAVLLLAGILSGQAWAVDCLPADIDLSTQSDVDNFQANHGPCDRVTGLLTVDGTDIENVDGLSALTSVGNGLRFLFATSLTNVDGLSSLSSISGNLFFTDSDSLTQVDGLSNLVTVGGSVYFQFNDVLTNLNGLSSLTSAGSLILDFNTALQNIDGLSSLTDVELDVRLESNTGLANVQGLSALTSVGGSLTVIGINGLADLEGLDGIPSLGGDLLIRYNPNLVSVDLTSLVSVDGNVAIHNNDSLAHLDGLSGLISVGIDLLVSENPELDQCAGLIKLLDDVDDGDPGPGPGPSGIPDVGNQAIFSDNLAGCNSISEIMTLFRDGFESPPNTFTTVDTGLGTGGTGAYCSIGIGGNGFPVISYLDNTNTTLKVAACGDVDCSKPGITISTVDGKTQMSGFGSSVANGADGLPVIGYLEQQIIPVGLKVAKCDDPACSGGNETVTMVVNPTVISEMDLAVGHDTFPVIAFGLAGELKVAKCNDSACQGMDESIVTIDDLGNQGALRLSLAIGSDHFPVISYYDAAAQALKVAKCNDQACAGNDEAIVTIDDPDSEVSWGTSIAMGSDGFPVISYGSYTTNELKVAKCGDIDCSSLNVTVSTVDNEGSQLALQTSIAIGRDGFPVISYQDSEDGLLKVAKCNDLACSGGDELVHTLDIGARHTSIAIGSDGLPVISYCNSISNDFALKVVHCGTSSCQ
jgi:hypothetical protein